ncbi:hypothetical protein P3X46_026834 [Hevea brasiliensis]|uniref:GATA-type domain-containing protein n=1 Tax=Hevea brasiliensis TaxID=3981 RepID=A0ABQ9KXW9_HEVBR|nr:GATA transcription factor 29 [Hevea brasiliensis]KAJ9153390.1 hypothetical protein P3X46_026834 [Hevea brasiliensis]
MDSERFQGAAEGRSKTGIYNRDDAGKMVDLTLKLGLPNEHKNDDHLANFNFSGPYTPLQGSSNNHGMIGAGGQVGVFHYGLANGGGNAAMANIGSSIPNVGQNFINASQISAWPLPEAEIGNSSRGSIMGISDYPNFNPRPSLSLMNGYIVLDSPSRKVNGDGDESGNSSRRKEVPRRQRYGSSVDPSKRCTNYNCNTNNTPMWRKGPLGPKTLCNACGIKYRKEGEKRRAKEAAKDSNA